MMQKQFHMGLDRHPLIEKTRQRRRIASTPTLSGTFDRHQIAFFCDRRRNAPWVCLKRNQHWNFACGLSTVCRRFDLMTRRLEVQLEFRALA